MVSPRRGDIFWVNLDPTVGSEIRKKRPGYLYERQREPCRGKRPAVVVSNDAANGRYHQVTVIPLTSRGTKSVEPFQVFLDRGESGLSKDSKALAEQIRTVSKLRLAARAGRLDRDLMQRIDQAIKVHLDLE